MKHKNQIASLAAASALNLVLSSASPACSFVPHGNSYTMRFVPSDMAATSMYQTRVIIDGAFYAQGNAAQPKCYVVGPSLATLGPGEITGTISFKHAPSARPDEGRTDLDRAFRVSLMGNGSRTLTQRELHIHELKDQFSDTNEISLTFSSDRAFDTVDIRLCQVDPAWTDIPITETKLTVSYNEGQDPIPGTCNHT